MNFCYKIVYKKAVSINLYGLVLLLLIYRAVLRMLGSGPPKLVQPIILFSDATVNCQESFCEVLNLYWEDFLKEFTKLIQIDII